MDNRFEKLNNSIMFNLSLSSKELFHSNLLGYLFSFDNTLFGKIVNIKDLVVKEVKREINNIDIEITDKDEKKYLVENKVKDIIDCTQLDNIQNKNKNHEKYYLFSLLGDNLEKLEKKYPLWEEISYERIISVLRKYNFNNETINIIKNDYCAFMLDMVTLLQQHYFQCDRYMLFWDGNDLLEQYKTVRLHDVFQKYGTSHFVSYFRKKYPNTEIKSTYGYIRNGYMTFSKEINNGEYSVEIQIQIENGEYRKSIVGKIKSEKKLLEMFESIGWFDKSWKSRRKKTYLSYDHKDGTKRWYQIPITVNNMSYNDLSKKIKTDFDDVIKKINKF
jgi:hypothetical protein